MSTPLGVTVAPPAHSFFFVPVVAAHVVHDPHAPTWARVLMLVAMKASSARDPEGWTEPLTPAEIGGELDRAPLTIQRLLLRLCDDGYLERSEPVGRWYRRAGRGRGAAGARARMYRVAVDDGLIGGDAA